MRFSGLCLALLLILPGLTACGKKPTFVDPPPEANLQSNTTSVEGNEVPADTAVPSKKQKDPFPRRYPKPWL